DVGDVGHARDWLLVLVLQDQRTGGGGVVDGLAIDANAAMGNRALILRRGDLGGRRGLVATLVVRVVGIRGGRHCQSEKQAGQNETALHGNPLRSNPARWFDFASNPRQATAPPYSRTRPLQHGDRHVPWRYAETCALFNTP